MVLTLLNSVHDFALNKGKYFWFDPYEASKTVV